MRVAAATISRLATRAPTALKARSLGPPACSLATSAGVILLLASTEDAASVAQHRALLDRGGWAPLPPPAAGTQAWASGDVRMWLLDEGFLHQDDVDKRWVAAGGERPSELIFLSRHAAASGKPCLTVHPIGVADLHASAETLERGGGRAGTLPPPARRLAPLWRRLCALKKSDALPAGFDVSLEATHHGPVVTTPACFVEIGSTEAEWDNAEAATALAGVISSELAPQLRSGEEQGEEDDDADQDVWVLIGGGHYQPKAGDLARKKGARLGHCLASYAVGFASPPADDDDDGSGSGNGSIDPAMASLVDGGGAHAIREAVRASREAWGCGEGDEGGDRGGARAVVRCQVDKKAFSAPRRDAICRLLEADGVAYRVK